MAPDIAELQRIQDELRESEARLRMTLDAAYLISFAWDIQRSEVRRLASKAAALAPAPEGEPETFADVVAAIHPDDRELLEAYVAAALARDDGEYSSEFRLLRAGGGIAWQCERGRVQRDAGGRPLRLVGLSQDITDRKLAEAALQQHALELAEANEELARFNRAAVGREQRMIELKQEVNALRIAAGLSPRYPLEAEQDGTEVTRTRGHEEAIRLEKGAG